MRLRGKGGGVERQVAGPAAVQVLVCGCGAVTERFYVPALRALEGDGVVRVAALVDPSDLRRSHLGARFPAARRYEDLAEGLSAIRPDLVIVASPHQFHRQHTVASLGAGSDVLCEKPLALSSHDCDEMIDAAERIDRVLGVGHFRRFFPSVQAMRSAIRANAFGRPLSFAALEGEIYRWPVTWPGARQPGAAGRGVFADIGPHALDLLSWWLGDLHIVSYSDDAIDGIEVNCRVELETGDGVRGTLRLSRDTVLPNRHVVTFERGWLAYNCDVPDHFEWGWDEASHAAKVVVGPKPPSSPMWGATASTVSPDPGRYFLLQLRNVIAAMKGHERLLVAARDARNGIALIEQCYASKTAWNLGWLDEQERLEAQRLSAKAP